MLPRVGVRVLCCRYLGFWHSLSQLINLPILWVKLAITETVEDDHWLND